MADNLGNAGGSGDKWRQRATDRGVLVFYQPLDDPQSRVATDRARLQEGLLVSRRLGGLGLARSSEGATHRTIPVPELKIGHHERRTDIRRDRPGKDRELRRPDRRGRNFRYRWCLSP